MATYTILTNSPSNNSSTVVIDFPVPNGSNDAGVPWQSVVAELRTDSGSINPRKEFEVAHVASLDAGEVIEIELTVEYNAKLPNDQKIAILNSAVNDEIERFTAEFSILNKFYGLVLESI